MRPPGGPARRGEAFDAVVIGASAGGVEALLQLLPALPPRLHAAVLVVQHLPRDRASLLADIFAPRCALPVVEAEDKMPIEPGRVYLAPPDYHLLVDGAAEGPRIALSTEAPVHWSRPAIDPLFESAAQAWGERVLGIVLTGGNADGAAGLAEVHARGGLAVVEAPATAQAATMPRAALERTPAAQALDLDAIAALLRGLAAGASAPNSPACAAGQPNR